eukprot:232865_1
MFSCLLILSITIACTKVYAECGYIGIGEGLAVPLDVCVLSDGDFSEKFTCQSNGIFGVTSYFTNIYNGANCTGTPTQTTEYENCATIDSTSTADASQEKYPCKCEPNDDCQTVSIQENCEDKTDHELENWSEIYVVNECIPDFSSDSNIISRQLGCVGGTLQLFGYQSEDCAGFAFTTTHSELHDGEMNCHTNICSNEVENCVGYNSVHSIASIALISIFCFLF